MSRKKNNNLHYGYLRKQWTKKHRQLQKEIFDKHKDSFEWLANNSRQLTVGTLAGIFLLTSPIIPKIQTAFSSNVAAANKTIDKGTFVIYDLKNVLPQNVRPLTQQEEKNVAEILSRDYGMNVAAELDGKRLNTTYGIIGQEQHLARYPGDNMFTHFDNPAEQEKYWDYGMAPGLGAWGYFSNSQDSMSKEDIQREKYYIAVQTFLVPGFNENSKEYTDFFKYRKMLVVNPENGKAIVADIADAGPSPSTGKQLGGSPEVMTYLERYDGSQRGPVLYFFIDDSSDKIPLGPISL
ncbi:MAG: hypothetical protein M1405_03240 [Patescibacteria group bacterium]|nr:hypothetical protein [Patescibacteria group bacterium]